MEIRLNLNKAAEVLFACLGLKVLNKHLRVTYSELLNFPYVDLLPFIIIFGQNNKL